MTAPEYRIITKASSHQDIQDIIPKILKIQGAWIVSRETSTPSRGFLISLFSQAELSSLIQKDGMLICAIHGTEILGYCLTTPISEFTELYQDSADGDLRTTSPFSATVGTHRYLYQIATDPTQLGHGIGQGLLEVAKQASAGLSFLTDVLTSPIENSASRRFFQKSGFIPVGELTLKSYRDFGELKSEVLEFTPRSPLVKTASSSRP
jgi:ribosomal protein S18 acetylase RimI-like enzyme